MIRCWLLIASLVGVIIVGVAFHPAVMSLWSRSTGWSSTVPPPTPAFTSAPSVEKIQPLAELVSLRVQVIDILTVEQDGWLTGYQGAWFIQGDALWTTDLKQARVREIHPLSGKPSVRIELPQPQIRWARLDHTHTQTYDLRSKSWLPLFRVPDEVRDEAYRRAQQLIAQTASQEEYRRQAQAQAETVLAKFYAEAGFPTEVVWVDQTPDK